ncbi:hypothetical protein ACFWTE_25995 [Nocardiopsis sp. NPDC058631]|uniref:hypothetical protein n=1 Tax=Nocardiopsis sp. NPDC058631 TaxID=3346566 RepID=UPI0036697299
MSASPDGPVPAASADGAAYGYIADMIPQGDPHPSKPRPQRLLWGARLRIYRGSHPRAFAARASGVLLFVMAASGILGFTAASGDVRMGTFLVAALLAVTGIVAAVVAAASPSTRRAARAREAAKLKNLPPGTDPAKLAEAWRLVREGRLGPDPEANRLGRIVVEGELVDGAAATSVTVFVPLALLNALHLGIRIREDGISGLVLLLLALTALMLVLVCVMPFSLRQRRRRAEAFRDAYDTQVKEAPDTAA